MHIGLDGIGQIVILMILMAYIGYLHARLDAIEQRCQAKTKREEHTHVS